MSMNTLNVIMLFVRISVHHVKHFACLVAFSPRDLARPLLSHSLAHVN